MAFVVAVFQDEDVAEEMARILMLDPIVSDVRIDPTGTSTLLAVVVGNGDVTTLCARITRIGGVIVVPRGATEMPRSSST